MGISLSREDQKPSTVGGGTEGPTEAADFSSAPTRAHCRAGVFAADHNFASKDYLRLNGASRRLRETT